MNQEKKSIILFLTETGIYPYLRSLSVLGDAVIKSGSEVFLTHCTGQMYRCPMMAMQRLPLGASDEEKKRLCNICKAKFNIAQKRYGFSAIDLEKYVDDNDRQMIEKLLSDNDKDLQNLIFKNVPVGKIAEYDFSLEAKVQVYPNLSNDHKVLYIEYIKNTILAVMLAEKICLNYNPSAFLDFNPYAQCQSVRAVAESRGIKNFFITLAGHKNSDASLFVIYEKLNSWFTHCARWTEFNKISILPKHVLACWDDVLFHFYGSGSHIFSIRKGLNPESIFKQFKLDSKKKTVVVYTSSNDERGGYEELLKLWKDDANFLDAFPNQISWLKWLHDYTKKRDDIQVLVRIHPREGKRQFGFGSKHMEQLKEAFSETSESFHIVWPDDPISSYDLMELADLCLVPWTTMGQEAARVGIPVLSCTGNMYYSDDDFMQVATTPEEYEKRLGDMLGMEYKWQHLVKAVRFYHWRTFIPALDLGETVPADSQNHNIWPEAPQSKVKIINDILSDRENLVEYNIKKWQESLSIDALTKETEAMKHGLRLFFDKIFYPPQISKIINILFRIWRKIWRIFFGYNIAMPQKSFVDYSLVCSSDISKLNDFVSATKNDTKLRVLVADEANVVLMHNGKMINRMSPVVSRLVKLYETVQDNSKIL